MSRGLLYNDGCAGTQSAVVIENYFPLIAIESDWVANERGQLTVKVNVEEREKANVFGDGPKEKEKCEIWMFYSPKKCLLAKWRECTRSETMRRGKGRRERMDGEGGVCWYVKSLVRPGAWVHSACLPDVNSDEQKQWKSQGRVMWKKVPGVLIGMYSRNIKQRP